jgi:hypothetical protein
VTESATWQCCGADAAGTDLSCNTPHGDHFNAPAPRALKELASLGPMTSGTFSRTVFATATASASASASATASLRASAAPASAQSSGLSSGAAAGVGVGVTLVTALLLATGVWHWRKRRNSNRPRSDPNRAWLGSHEEYWRAGAPSFNKNGGREQHVRELSRQPLYVLGSQHYHELPN